MTIKIFMSNVFGNVKPKIKHMIGEEIHALTPREFLIDFNRMMVVLSEFF
ncbi:MAG TPA: hypothetical protein PLJ39_04100 [Spirochaetota bacterium]|nr:hypothetical protein [Spirochaetota bacterium]